MLLPTKHNLSIGSHYPRCSLLSQEVRVSDQIASTCFPQYWSLCLCTQFNEGQEHRDKDISKSQSGIPVLDARICFMAETRTVPLMARSRTWGSQMLSWLVPVPPPVTMATRDLGCRASMGVPDLQSLPNSHFPFQSPLLSPVNFATLCSILPTKGRAAPPWTPQGSSSLSTRTKPISTQPYLLAKSPFCCPEICLPILSSSLPLLPQFLQLPFLYLLSPSRLSAPYSFCFLILASVFFCSLCPLLASITASLHERLSFWGCHQLLNYTPPPPPPSSNSQKRE